MNTARMITRTVRGGAQMQPSGITVRAGQTEDRDIYKPIRVSPVEAQTLQWLTPGNAVQYQIVTNLDWTIE